MDWTGSFNPMSIVSGGFQALGNYFAARQQAKDNAAQRRFQKEMWENQARYNAQMMERQNEMTLENQEIAWEKYDSPVAQRRAMSAAGMNPFVEGSSLQPGVSSGQPGASPASASLATPPPIGSSKYEAMMAMGDAVGKSLLLSADIELKKSEARKNNAAAEGQENVNKVFDIDRENKIRDSVANKAAADAIISEADAQYQTIKNSLDREERTHRIEEARKRIEHIGLQNDLTQAQIEVVRQEFWNKLAEEGYINEQAYDLRETRKSRIAKNWSEVSSNKAAVAKFDAEIGNIKSMVEARGLDITLNRINELKKVIGENAFSNPYEALSNAAAYFSNWGLPHDEAWDLSEKLFKDYLGINFDIDEPRTTIAKKAEKTLKEVKERLRNRK